MTEERKFAILFATTILAARRLIDMDLDKPNMAKGSEMWNYLVAANTVPKVVPVVTPRQELVCYAVREQVFNCYAICSLIRIRTRTGTKC